VVHQGKGEKWDQRENGIREIVKIENLRGKRLESVSVPFGNH